jgi:hypothetical protein
LIGAAIGGAWLLSTGCTFILSTDADQCVVDADCTARGADFAATVCADHVCQAAPDPAWECVGHVVVQPDSTKYTAAMKVFDLLSSKPATGADVRLCNLFDPPCTTPVATLPVAADGTVSTMIAPSFKGFFFIQTPDDHVPTLYSIDTFGDGSVAKVALLSHAASSALNAAFPVKPAAGSGSMSITMNNCAHQRAAGVHFDIDVSGAKIPYYVAGGAVSPTATQTDAGGLGGFAGLQEGTVTITARLVKTNQVLAKVSTLIRSGGLTYLPISPTPLE